MTNIVKLTYSDDPSIRSARTEKVRSSNGDYYLITLQQSMWGYDEVSDFRDAVIAHECAHIELGHVDSGGDLPLDKFIQREIEADTHSIVSGKTKAIYAMGALRLASTPTEWSVYTDPTSKWGARLKNLMYMNEITK